MNKRKKYLDIAKGIAIILVVMGHLLGEGGISFRYSELLHNYIYSFHMPVFFLISGIGVYYSMSRQEKNNKTVHLILNIKRLLVLYVVWSGIYFLLSNVNTIENIREWFYCIISFRGRAPIWYLGALALSELMLIIVCEIAENKQVDYKVCLRVSMAIMIIFTYIGEKILEQFHYTSILGNYLLVTINRMWPVSFFVFSGYLVADILDKGKEREQLFVAGITSFAYVLSVYKMRNSVNMHTAILGNVTIFYIEAILGSIALLYFCKIIENIAAFKIIIYLGKSTLAIMTFHYFPFSIMLNSVKLSRKILGTHEVGVLTMSLFFIIGCCCLIQEILKRIKIV